MRALLLAPRIQSVLTVRPPPQNGAQLKDLRAEVATLNKAVHARQAPPPAPAAHAAPAAATCWAT